MGLRKIRFFVHVFVGAVLLVLSVHTFVHAQTPSNTVTLGISPLALDLTANPGESQSHSFRLTNSSDDAVDIRTIAKNFVPRGEGGAAELTEADTSFSLADWISVEPATARIAAKDTQDFTVIINVPSNAEPGSHFGSVVFQTIPPEDASAAALVSQEIAPVILVKIAGDIIETAEIEEFRAEQSLFSSESSIPFVTRIKNTGTAHFKPTAKITIKNMFGSEVEAIELQPENILPDSIRVFPGEWTPSGFTVGRYTAELTIAYGENNEIHTASTSFIVFPYQTILPAAAVVVGLGVLVFRGRKRLVLAAKVLSGKQ